jgi:ferrous iron transport protein A
MLENKLTTLSQMCLGQQGEVEGFLEDDQAYRMRLLAMGLTRGTPFKLVKKAPLGDPVEIKIRGFSLTLRKSEAEVIQVRSENGCPNC